MISKRENGQAMVLMVLFLAGLLGMAALVLDVGSWFREKRQLQLTADASALAGAQVLPGSPSGATSLALQYATTNGRPLTTNDISISSDLSSNDTITVDAHSDAPGFFSKLFGITSVTVGAKASARSDNIKAALRVAPIVVNWKHPMLQCKPLPCPDPTEIDLADLKNPGSSDAAGAFGLIDLLQDDNGSVGSSTLNEWITKGFDEYMPLGLYDSAPSAKFNSVEVRDAMTASIGQVLLFPIYDSILGPGSNAQYNVIGWVGFHVTGFDASGNTGKVFGWFTRRITEGIQAQAGDNIPDYGARAVQLVN
jgi:hypothetical protein